MSTIGKEHKSLFIIQSLNFIFFLLEYKGPGEVMQIAEIESQDGFSRPFKMKVDCSDGRFYGSTTVAVRNVGQLEFPIIAKVSY